jgi:anti-sigma B factor antagonist
MDGQLRTSALGDRVVVQVVGDLDICSAPAVRAEVERLIDGDQTDVLVDLTKVTFIDSTGIGALVGTLKKVRSREGRLELVLNDPKVLKTFRIAGLTGVFVIHSDLDHALTGPW